LERQMMYFRNFLLPSLISENGKMEKLESWLETNLKIQDLK
jgi:hypothetical protein